MVLGGTYSFTISRVGLLITLDIVDTTTLQNVGTASASFVTQAPRMNRCFSNTAANAGWNEKVGGVIQLGSGMSLDMDQPEGTTVIPDGVGSNDATVTAPAVFELEGGAALPDITFTNFVDNAFATVTDLGNGDAAFTVSGTIENGATVSEIEWKRGAGTWQSLIVSPATSWTSAAITINDADSITFRSTDEPATEYEFLNITAAVVIGARGQSNIRGRGAMVQPTLANGKQAFMLDSIDAIVTYNSPHALPSDPTSAAGSYIDNIVQKVTESGFHVAVITGSKGATSIATHVKGQTLYTSFLRRVDTILSQTVNLNIWDQGNADYDGDLSGREVMLNQFVDDLFTDTGGKTYIVDINLTAADGLRTINANVIASNLNAEFGGTMVGIMPTDDTVHLATLQELEDAATEVYQYLGIGVFSSLDISFTGVTDGTYTVVLDAEDGTRLSRSDRVITSNAFTELPLLGVASGSRIKGHLDDNLAASVEGVYIEGVTT